MHVEEECMSVEGAMQVCGPHPVRAVCFSELEIQAFHFHVCVTLNLKCVGKAGPF